MEQLLEKNETWNGGGRKRRMFHARGVLHRRRHHQYLDRHLGDGHSQKRSEPEA